MLFLDAHDSDLVEEMGGMNVFFVKKGALVTPPLDDTVLPGITRDTIFHLAADLGIPCEEEELSMQSVEQEIRSGVITEAIACGTAAAVTNIGAFHFEDGKTLEIG